MQTTDLQRLAHSIGEALSDPSDTGKWIRTGLIIGGFIVFLITIERLTRKTKESKAGPLTFSNMRLLQDGLYTVTCPFNKREIHTVVVRANAGRYDSVYLIPTDEIPRSEDGAMVEHFIKENGFIS